MSTAPIVTFIGKLKRSRVMQLTLAFFLPAMTLIVLLSLYFSAREYDFHSIKIRSTLEQLLANSQLSLLSQNEFIVSDLDFITTLPDLTAVLLNESSPGQRQSITSTLSTLSEARPGYTKIRIIDVNGHEQISILHPLRSKASAQPDSMLQDLHLRTFFTQSIKLPRQDIYIASSGPAGQDSLSTTPFIRIAKPIRGASGRIIGVAVINSNGIQQAETLMKHESIAGCNTMLVTHDGISMAHPGRDDGSRKLPQDDDPGITASFPEEWSYIKTRTEGQLLTSKGLFIFRRLYLIPYRSPMRGNTASSEGNYWIMIQHVPPSLIKAMQSATLDYMLMAGAAGIIMFIGALFLAIRIDDSRRKRQELETVTGTIPAFIFMKDCQLRYSFANQYALNQLQCKKETIINKRSGDIFPADTAALFEKEDQEILQTGKSIINQNGEILLADGTTIAVLTNKVPLTNYNNEIEGIISVSMDWSMQKESEEKNRMLENKLRNRQKLEMLGTLAGGIAHDFNNLLTPIIGYTELVLETLPEKSELRDSLKTVIKAAMRGKKLIRQMLMFGRNDTPILRPSRLQPILEEALDFLRPSIPSTVRMETRIADFSDSVMCDPMQIQQIILNLCTNALQAMVNETGTISVELNITTVEQAMDSINKQLLRDQLYASITVRDNGTGMPKHVSDCMFDPFYTTKEVGKGTGLGLSVVYGIVKAHKGEIGVESTEGTGTAVTVFLPVIKKPTADNG